MSGNFDFWLISKVITILVKRNACFIETQSLSGSSAKSGPLNFGTKNTYVQKSNLLFSISIFLFCYEPKLNFGRTEVADHDQKGKILRFCEARYVP